ncbi:MAG TPA: chromate transporter [Xanthobacteraceae bacterium]|nr:chromate transporter [Xanthobacteraceae bacterium]
MSSPAGPCAPAPPASNAPPAAAPPQPTIAELFAAFAAISLSGFGGVLAWARRIMVERRRWFTAEQFNEAFALCAFLPGGNMVNFAVIFGARMRGPLGALAALGGLLGPPMILVIAVGALYAHYGDLPALRRILTGVAAAAAGLMLATVAKMARPLFKDRAVVAPLMALVTFAAIGILHWPLPLVLLVIVPVSIGAAFRNNGMRR